MQKKALKRYYVNGELPPLVKIKAGPKIVDVYGWKPNDAGEPMPAIIGKLDPDADIQACRTETLPEMMARMPGKNPLEKVTNAVNTGLIIPPVEEGKTVYDLTKVPNDIVEAKMAQQKGQVSYDKLPDELKNAEGKTIEEKIVNYIKSVQAASVKEADKETAQ